MKSSIEAHLGKEWYDILKDEFKKPYISKLQRKVKLDRQWSTVYPRPNEVFKAYRLTPYSEVKAIILGQDPYPHYHAHGLAFSAKETMFEEIPKSLQNIFAELEYDIRFQMYHNPDLSRWAKQGVFLLNRVLTVKANRPNSHADYGWEKFTNATIEALFKRKDPLVFILWGHVAQRIMRSIPRHHHVIPAPHPSSRSAYRGFFGHRPFSRTNEYLIKDNKEPINWLKND